MGLLGGVREWPFVAIEGAPSAPAGHAFVARQPREGEQTAVDHDRIALEFALATPPETRARVARHFWAGLLRYPRELVTFIDRCVSSDSADVREGAFWASEYGFDGEAFFDRSLYRGDHEEEETGLSAWWPWCAGERTRECAICRGTGLLLADDCPACEGCGRVRW